MCELHDLGREEIKMYNEIPASDIRKLAYDIELTEGFIGCGAAACEFYPKNAVYNYKCRCKDMPFMTTAFSRLLKTAKAYVRSVQGDIALKPCVTP